MDIRLKPDLEGIGGCMRFKIIIGAVILVLVLSVSIFYFLVKEETALYKAEVTTEECSDNYQKASEMLMKRYLSHYCSPLVGKSVFLTDYRIIEINARSVSNQADCYEFIVTYDVRMFTDNDWIAGNGTIGKNGWINEKIGFGKFHKEGNKYIFDGIGTGP
jgi:hypothetical protein